MLSALLAHIAQQQQRNMPVVQHDEWQRVAPVQHSVFTRSDYLQAGPHGRK